MSSTNTSMEWTSRGLVSKLLNLNGGQGRNRTADAGLFRAAYRFAEVV
jgi:hypothetical protein